MLITNIAALHGILPGHVGRLRGTDMASGMSSTAEAWLQFSDGIITAFGSMDSCPADDPDIIDAQGGLVLPAFCDSHTHIIYASSRQGEFVDKIRGLSYEEVARRGGGILNSADVLAHTSEEELYQSARRRALDMMAKGTGAFEVKTGYGLSTATELKMLRVAARLRDELPARVAITFLGAHAVARSYAGRQAEYVDMVISEMLPAIAAEGIAQYVDVFCDAGFFTPDETARIVEAGMKYGMKAKIHGNELGNSGGVEVAVAHGALSVDHLEQAGDDQIALLAASDTVATMLPGASFFSRLPYGPARKAIDAGCTVALASDYNPGSSPSGDMRFVWALGCIQQRLLPAEALAAVTVNGAAAMGMGLQCGAISAGRDASVIITRPLPDLPYIPYAYTEPWIARTIIRGKMI